MLSDDKLKRCMGYVGIAIVTTTIVLRLMAWLMTDSLSLLTNVVDAVIDAIGAMTTGFGVRYATRPPDAGHRFGHGKAEAMAALVQAMLLTGAAVVLICESIIGMIKPHGISALNEGVIYSLLCLGLTIALVLLQSFVLRRVPSQAISADRSHYLADIFATCAVIIALMLTRSTHWPYFDPAFALVIALLFIRSALSIGRDAMDTLLDSELPNHLRESIQRIVMAHPEISGLHDLRTRSSGQHEFIEFHLELDGEKTVRQAHDVTVEIELALSSAFPKAEVIVHIEPIGINDDRLYWKIDTVSQS